MKQTAPLSKSQYGIYAECMAHQGEICYNLPYIYILDGALNASRLLTAIATAFRAHPALFTRIEAAPDGEPVQTVDMEKESWQLSVEDVQDLEEVKNTLVTPFNLYGERLFRIRVFHDTSHYYLFIDLHHIIADGTSMKIILEDIETAYRGRTLAPEGLTMAGEAEREAGAAKPAAREEARQWYARTFDCSEVSTPLMPDLEDPLPAEANTLRTLDIPETQVNNFCKKNGIFRSTLFTCAYAYLLAKYNNERQSLFTTVYHGRTDKRLHRTVGMFVKTLPVYAKHDETTTVLDYLQQCQEQMSAQRRYEAYPYHEIQHDLQLQTDTMFAWHADIFAGDTFMDRPMQTLRIGNSTTGVSLYIKMFILGGRYRVKAEYAANAYSPELIDNFLESYEAVVRGFLTQEKLCHVALTSPRQTDCLDRFNLTDRPYDDGQTVVSLFRRQARATPDNVAVVYGPHRYTYAQADELSDRIAARIARQGLGAEDVVSILIPRCQWMAIASLGVLKAGCAYQPLDPTYPKERLNFMMQDAGAKLLIADTALFPLVDGFQGDVIYTSDLPNLPAGGAAPKAPAPDNLFIMLYTSGSTGVPKGCQLTHANLVAFCHWYQRYYDLQPDHRVAAYASYGFDACMMDMYPALTCGASVHIVPEELRLDLMALNDYFEQHHITHAFMTTQVGYQFASSMQCRSLMHLTVGGEKLAAIAPPKGYTLHNAYGPTECTIFTTTYPVSRKMKETPIGRALDNMRLYVVDSQGHRQPVGAAGELWVSGPQVSRGYLNRPEKTAEAYIENPFSAEKKYGRIYRTGDIVRYLPSGNIQFVGRRDGQVKIRGFRIELKEVESVIRDYPGIRDVTVQAFDDTGGGKYIAAYIVSDKPVDAGALNAFILEQKPPYMVPAVTMQIEAIPLTQNQKVNKRALPLPEKKAETVQEPSDVPMNVLEEELHDIIAEVVNTKAFGITTNLGSVGLTSISSIRLAVLVNKRYGAAVDARQLVKTGTLQFIENEILKTLMKAPTTASPSLPAKGAATTDVPLSYAQTGVYLECLKNPTSTIYNIPYLLTYPSDTDAASLAEAVRKTVACHPEFNVHFETADGTVIQTTRDSVPVQVDVIGMSDEALTEYKKEFVMPFNLQKAPLYRFKVVCTPGAVCLLMDVHHLIFDGGSADLFIRQISAVLEGKPIEVERYGYFDFVRDQQASEETDTFKASQDFFAEKLQACEGASEIPGDRSKTDSRGFIGEAVCPADYEKTGAFCRQIGVTPAHLFFAATAYVVSRYTNNRDVFLCTVSSGRNNLKIAETTGMFVNTLPLGISIGDVSVTDFIRTAGDTFEQTLRHEEYPFSRIAADYGFRPAIAYAYQVGVLSEYTVNGKRIGQELLELNVPKFKINIKIESRGVVVQYDDAIYSPALARALAESIVAVTEHMMAQPAAPVRKTSIVSPNQERQLQTLRTTDTGEPPFRFFHDCISHFAGSEPEHQALVACDGAYTYAEMDEITNRMACSLRQRGVNERDRVALLLPRTSRLILALFGVLKAGAAYIPCDPEYPADRIKLILEDSEARYIITTADRMANVPAEKAVNVEDLLKPGQETAVPSLDITPDDLAYLIYTSGSTGRPKGVMLRHQGICNYLYGHPANVFAHAVLTDARRILSVTTISFDAALQDIGMAFFNGKTLVVATEEQANNPPLLAALITSQRVDMVSGTPSRWQTWLTSDDFARAIAGIRIVRAGGEKFSDSLLQQLKSVTTARIFNCYGPTEITVASNNKELTRATAVTVGRPQLGVKEFIVDGDGNELPVGVVGELYIGGRGVARGYNRLEQMTRERFIEYRGERVYRSGDYAKWAADGDVIILGRTDNQIKLRGLRIELGEIENVMLKVDGMKKVVIVIRKLGGKDHLCAYYTAGRTIAPDALKAEIAKSLTPYMVPTAYLQLDEMPMTPNGKTDVKALPEPELAVSSTYTEPVGDTERTLCNIFADILQTDRVGATDNFFELGGTSLVVTRVIIEADKAGMHVAYGDVFANPTPRQLARLITGDGATGGDDEVSDYDYSAIDALLGRNTLDAFRKGERQRLGNVLLTGCTGFLGIHILKELIDSDAETIYCLVRGKSPEQAEHRLKTLLFYYFGAAFADLFGRRLRIVPGDVTRDVADDLPIDTVFNCAAVVKHFAEGTEIEDVNIGGARRLVDFCRKRGARLVHVSTASTRGLALNGRPAPTDVFTEQRFYMGQYLGNKYIYSKFMAERLILQAVAAGELSAKIMRVGNLSARSTDGEFQANFATNAFMGRIRVYNMLGCCPYGMRNKQVEFSPVNEVAQAIVKLAATPKDCCVFHPYNIHTQLLGDVLAQLRFVGDGIRFVEQEDFDKAMDRAGNDPQQAKRMASLLAYQDMAHGQKTADVNRSCDYTTQVLYRLGHSWSFTSWDYVQRMLTAIGGLGFFE